MVYTKSQIKTTTIPFTIDYVVVLCQMEKKNTNASHHYNIESHDKARIKEALRHFTSERFLDFAVKIPELFFSSQFSFLFRCETQLLE